MAHFYVETNDDGSVRHILRDGELYDDGVSLEPLFSIVILYFKVAESNIQLLEKEEGKRLRRAYGVQSFVMSLTGLEAFTNTYFKLQGDEFGKRQSIERVGKRHGSLTKKIKGLLAMTSEELIEDQDIVLDQFFELSQFRNALFHPQWEPTSITLSGNMPLAISGLVLNFQAVFDDPAFCREALMWCMLLVARVGQSRGNSDVFAFLFHWTGIYGLSEQKIMCELGLV